MAVLSRLAKPSPVGTRQRQTAPYQDEDSRVAWPCLNGCCVLTSHGEQSSLIERHVQRTPGHVGVEPIMLPDDPPSRYRLYVFVVPHSAICERVRHGPRWHGRAAGEVEGREGASWCRRTKPVEAVSRPSEKDRVELMAALWPRAASGVVAVLALEHGELTHEQAFVACGVEVVQLVRIGCLGALVEVEGRAVWHQQPRVIRIGENPRAWLRLLIAAEHFGPGQTVLRAHTVRAPLAQLVSLACKIRVGATKLDLLAVCAWASATDLVREDPALAHRVKEESGAILNRAGAIFDELPVETVFRLQHRVASIPAPYNIFI